MMKQFHTTLKVLFTISICHWCHDVIAQYTIKQQKEIDSLNLVIQESNVDSAVSNAYLALSDILYISNLDTMLPLCEKAKDIIERNLSNSKLTVHEKNNFKKSLAVCYNNLGYFFENKGAQQKGMQYYHKAKIIQEEIGDMLGVAISLNNLGHGNYSMGNMDTAIGYFNKALLINERANNIYGVAANLNNIGLIYQDQGNLPKALDYYHKILSIAKSEGYKNVEAIILNNIGHVYHIQKDTTNGINFYRQALVRFGELNDKQQMANTFNNIGGLYFDVGDLVKALNYNNKSLAIKEDIDDKRGIGVSLNHIGEIHYLQGDKDKAVEFWFQALEMHKEIDHKQGIVNSSINIGRFYHDKGVLEEALDWGTRSMELAKKVGNPGAIEKVALLLSKVYAGKGDWRKESQLYKIHVQMRDSIQNIETAKKIIRQGLQYKYDNEQALLKAEHDKQIKLREEQTRKQKTYSIFIGSISLLLFILGVLVYRNEKRKRKLIEYDLEVSRLNALIEKNQFENKINLKSKELLNLALRINQNEQFSNELNVLLKEIQSTNNKEEIKKKIQRLRQKVKIDEYQKKNQEEFQRQFEGVHKDFIQSLKIKYPKLTTHELKICAFIKMNMSSHEICSFLNTSLNTLSRSRYRIHKKMELPKGDKLADYLMQYSQ